jgi:hypothetical protein
MRFSKTLKHTVTLVACALLFAAIATAQEYQILHASYGTAHRNIDVTQRLRQLAAANATFRLTWRTFGDPAEGRAKSLRIYVRGPRGAKRVFEYQDNSIIDGSMFSGWGGGNWGSDPWNGGWNPGPGWSIGHPGPGRPPGGGQPGGGNRGQLQILSAKYGSGRQQVDVTSRLQSLVNNGRLSVQVNNGSMAVGDPAPQQPKNLFVSYSVGNGQRQTRTVQEGSYLTLP